MKHVKSTSAMNERELGEHIELWHEDLWLVSRSEHAQDHRRRRQFHRHDRPARAEPVTQLKIQSAEDMSADVLWQHVQARHPELRYEKHVAPLREEHRITHQLIPLVLGHYHQEPAGEIATVADGLPSG